jgi:hypothetical protein
MENADGFAAKLTCGEGNVFDGCMSYNNSDDGWDLFAKSATGPIGVVTIKNCIAFRNGYTEDGRGYGDCDGNGFKLGGSGVGTAHIVENCLAFENLHCGFTDNNNPKLGSLTNCTAYNNDFGGDGKPNFSVYRCTDTVTQFTNLISYLDSNATKLNNDKFVGKMTNSIYYNGGKYYNISDATTIDNGDKTGSNVTLSSSDFISLTVPEMGTDFHSVWRNADGSLNTGGFVETTGTYESMGYHFTSSSSTTPVTTTATSVSTAATSTTTQTTTATVNPSTGGYVHDFTANGTSSSFYTINGNLSTSKGTVVYDGKTLTQCLKLESSTSVSFDATESGSITLVFAESDATIKVDGTKYTADGDGIITVDLSAGSHTVTKADTANLFYMVYSTTASSETTTKNDTLLGDANCSGAVDIDDVVAIACYVSDASENPLTEQGLINADVYDIGSGVNGLDALSVQKYLVKIIDVLPEK